MAAPNGNIHILTKVSESLGFIYNSCFFYPGMPFPGVVRYFGPGYDFSNGISYEKRGLVAEYDGSGSVIYCFTIYLAKDRAFEAARATFDTGLKAETSFSTAKSIYKKLGTKNVRYIEGSYRQGNAIVLSSSGRDFNGFRRKLTINFTNAGMQMSTVDIRFY